MQTLIDFFRDNLAWIVSLVTILATGFAYVYRHIRALQLGVQALLRAQMVDLFSHYDARGYAPLYARDSFESLWKNYTILGGNGFVTDLHSHFMALPTRPDAEPGDATGKTGNAGSTQEHTYTATNITNTNSKHSANAK